MFGRGPASFHRLASGRHLVDHGNIQVAKERQRKRARNRRSGHHQYVGRRAFFDESFALQNAEAVLFVDDDQAQAGKGNGIFEQRVRADHELRRAAAGALQSSSLIHRLLAADDEVHGVARAGKNAPRGEEMLHGEDFGRSHQRHLPTVFDNDSGSL